MERIKIIKIFFDSNSGLNLQSYNTERSIIDHSTNFTNFLNLKSIDQIFLLDYTTNREFGGLKNSIYIRIKKIR